MAKPSPFSFFLESQGIASPTRQQFTGNVAQTRRLFPEWAQAQDAWKAMDSAARDPYTQMAYNFRAPAASAPAASSPKPKPVFSDMPMADVGRPLLPAASTPAAPTAAAAAPAAPAMPSGFDWAAPYGLSPDQAEYITNKFGNRLGVDAIMQRTIRPNMFGSDYAGTPFDPNRTTFDLADYQRQQAESQVRFRNATDTGDSSVSVQDIQRQQAQAKHLDDFQGQAWYQQVTRTQPQREQDRLLKDPQTYWEGADNRYLLNFEDSGINMNPAEIAKLPVEEQLKIQDQLIHTKKKGGGALGGAADWVREDPVRMMATAALAGYGASKFGGPETSGAGGGGGGGAGGAAAPAGESIAAPLSAEHAAMMQAANPVTGAGSLGLGLEGAAAATSLPAFTPANAAFSAGSGAGGLPGVTTSPSRLLNGPVDTIQTGVTPADVASVAQNTPFTPSNPVLTQPGVPAVQTPPSTPGGPLDKPTPTSTQLGQQDVVTDKIPQGDYQKDIVDQVSDSVNEQISPLMQMLNNYGPLIGAGLGALSSSNAPSSQTVVTRNEPPEYAMPNLQQIMDESQRLYGQGGPEYYPGDRTAPFSADTQNAMDMIRQRVGAGSPVLNAAQQNLEATLRGDFLSPETNPFLQQTFDLAADKTRSRLASEFSRSGRNVGESMPFRSDELQMLSANLFGNNYFNERQNQMNALNYAVPLSREDYYGAGQLANVGQAVQDQNQRIIDEQIARFDYGQNRPQANLNNYLGRVTNAIGNQGMTSSTTPLYNNPMTGALGGAMLLGGLLG